MDTQPQNSEATPVGDPGQPSDNELFRLGAETASRHAAEQPGVANPPPVKRGPGRPPKHGRYSKAAGSDGKSPAPLSGRPSAAVDDAPGEMPPETPPRPAFPPDLVERAAVEVCGIAEDAATGWLNSKAAKAKLAGPEVSALIESVKMGEGRKKLVGELAPHAVAEMGIDPTLSPTGCITVILGAWGANVYRAAKALESAAGVASAPVPADHAA